MKPHALLVSLTLAGLPAAALANNDMSEAGRDGTLSAPSIDDSTHNASSVSVNQGRAAYSIPIVVPPGHPNLQPSVSLSYSGGRSEGVFGAGWSLSTPSIRVRVIGQGGQPRYGASVVYLGLNGEPLIDVQETVADLDSDGTSEAVFFEERNGSRARYVQLSTGGWLVQQPDGKQLKLGTTSATQIVREGAATEIAAWLPETLEDRVGNQQLWIWSDGATVGGQLAETSYNTVERYLTEMRWGCQNCDSASSYQSLTLDYGVLPSHILDFSAGFLRETEFFVTAINTWTTSSGSATPVRSYTLDYDSCSDTRRLLCQVDVAGADGSSNPPITLSYTGYDRPALPITIANAPGISFSDGVQAVDVDVDGRVDVASLRNAITGIEYYRSSGATEAGFDAAPQLLDIASGKLPGANLSASSFVSLEDATRSLTLDLFDLVPDIAGNSWLYPHNNVDGWGGAGIPITLPSITVGQNTLRIDVDNDGNVDLLDTSLYPWVLHLDDGSRTFPETIVLTPESTPTFGSGLTAAAAGVLVGDINGDGLSDIVYLDVNCVTDVARIFWGRGIGGFGWFEAEDRDAPFFSQYSTYPIDSVLGCPAPSEASLADIDGDGLADLVSLEASSGNVRVWKNIPGQGFSDAGLGSPFPQVISNTNGCRLADWDSDGVREIACSDGWKLYDFANQMPQLLQTVDNGRGLSTTLRFTTSARVAAAHADAGHAWSTKVSMVLPLVSELETNDGRGNILVETFDYRDPFYLQDELEQRFEFIGFGFSEQRQVAYLETVVGDPATRVPDPQDDGALSRTWFDVGQTDYFLRGTQLCQESWDPTTPPTTYDCGEDGALARVLQVYAANQEANGLTTVVEQQSVDSYQLEGLPVAAGRHTRSELEYDAYGNQTVVRNFGDTSVAGDEQMTVNAYINNTELWLVGLTRQTSQGSMDLSAIPPSLVTLEERCVEYDNTPELCDPAIYSPVSHDIGVTQGLATGQWVHEDDNLADGTPGTWVARGNIVHNSLGLPDLVTDAVAAVTDLDYDADFGFFLSQKTVDPSGLNLTTSSVIDAKHGQVVQTVGPDGETTVARFDDLGRLTGLVRPGDTIASPTQTRSYTPGAPLSTIVDRVKDGTANGLVSEHRIDGFGRTVCSLREDLGSLSSITQAEYTGRGLKALNYLPTLAQDCDVTLRNAAGGRTSNRSHQLTQYDALGRPLKSAHQPSGSFSTVSYAAGSRIETDEEGRATKKIQDGLGRTTAVIEYVDLDGDGTPEAHRMAYAHDARGALTEVRNRLGGANDVIFTAVHDSLGRQTAIWDATRGAESFAYDDLDRMVTHIDARNHQRDIAFDNAGRVDSVTATDDALVSQTTTYVYDVHPGGATASCRTTGRLAQVMDDSGDTVFCYDNRGRTLTEATTIDLYDPLTPLVTERRYDAAGRLQRLKYPDNVQLLYSYDRGGRPKTLTVRSSGSNYPLVTGATYAGSGQLRTMSFGNGADFETTYDTRQRPDQHTVGLNGAPQLNLSMSFDDVGNVLSVSDTLGDRSATYGYDGRYRLTSASGDFANGETLSYSYDLNGNLVSRASSDLSSPLNIPQMIYAEFNDPEPLHALLGVDADADGLADVGFTYDASGNLDVDDRYAFSYNVFGKLKTVEDLSGTLLMRHSYDYQQRRVASEVPSAADVFYVRPANMEIRDLAGVEVWRKHVSFGAMTVAVVDGTFTAGTKTDHIFMMASDPSGTPLMVMDVATPANVVEQHATFPFGADNTHPTGGQALSANDDASKLSRRFQGREIETEFGDFTNFGARMLRTDFARFLTADSVVPNLLSSESWNRYTFVRNNPLRYVDPTGHTDEPWWESSSGGLTIDHPVLGIKASSFGMGGKVTFGHDGMSGDLFAPGPGDTKQTLNLNEYSISFKKLKLGYRKGEGPVVNLPFIECTPDAGCGLGRGSVGILSGDEREASVGLDLSVSFGPNKAGIFINTNAHMAENNDGLRDAHDWLKSPAFPLEDVFSGGRTVHGRAHEYLPESPPQRTFSEVYHQDIVPWARRMRGN